MAGWEGTAHDEIQVLEPGWYRGRLVSFSDPIKGANGEFVFWRFEVEDTGVECSVITSIPEPGVPPGRNTKGCEFSRRMQGFSHAVDQKFGRDIKDRRKRVSFGPELIDLEAAVLISKEWDESAEEFDNRVETIAYIDLLDELKNGHKGSE